MPSKKQTAKRGPTKVKVERLRKPTERLTAKEQRKVKGGLITSVQWSGGHENPTETVSLTPTSKP